MYLNILPNSSLMYRTKLAKKVGWYSRKLEYSQDYDLTLKLIKVSETYIVKKYLTFIRSSQNNMTNSFNLKPIIFKENILNLKKNYLETKDLKEKKIIKDVIDINFIKLNLLILKKGNLNTFFSLLLIFFRNPLLLFKLNLLKKITEYKNC